MLAMPDGSGRMQFPPWEALIVDDCGNSLGGKRCYFGLDCTVPRMGIGCSSLYAKPENMYVTLGDAAVGTGYFRTAEAPGQVSRKPREKYCHVFPIRR